MPFPFIFSSLPLNTFFLSHSLYDCYIICHRVPPPAHSLAFDFHSSTCYDASISRVMYCNDYQYLVLQLTLVFVTPHRCVRINSGWYED